MNATTTEFTIRPAQWSDAPALRDLMEKTFVDTYASYNTPANMQLYTSTRFGLAQVQLELQDENVHYLIVEKQSEFIGFAKLIQNHSAEGLESKKVVEIERIYVEKTYHGQQLGAQLMQACLEWAKESTVEVVWLGVWEHNPKAFRFYEKMGFERFGAHTFTLGTEVQNDFLMKREI